MKAHPFLEPKYAFPRKLKAWVSRREQFLVRATSGLGLVILVWQISQHGGWAALPGIGLVSFGALILAVVLWPVNLGLEVAKWRHLKSKRLGDSSWKASWGEVLVGQAWALFGPFRLADGAGRWAMMREASNHGVSVEGNHPNTAIEPQSTRSPRAREVATAFGWGAVAQGWATWLMGGVAMVVWGWMWPGLALCVACMVGAVLLTSRGATWTVLGLSLARYLVFASQYVACLVAFGVVTTSEAWSEGFPRVAAIWCALHSIPWPVELGMREAVAVLVFDQTLPSVVVATGVVWLINRAGSAFLGGLWGWIMPASSAIPQRLRRSVPRSKSQSNPR
ncbi:MAG: hypothetical protein O3B70_07410 [Bacteroidetes bacterium]|nr:hypothetical protein [Bacteroidota bacterium]MDA0904149.1 hypothetical protein [Bacteroidota bacterium]MDA1242673.1 hypothetical protein [Bacteroidota bacterium]